MKQTKVHKTQLFVCDYCNKREEVTKESETSWITVTEVSLNKLRLFQAPKDNNRYESFNIPGKKDKTYCTSTCAIESFNSSLRLFLAELSPIVRSNKHKAFQ